MSKLLIIDKNIFQRTSTEELIKFVKNYKVVLPNTLFIECIISDDEGGKKLSKNPIGLLTRFDSLIVNGAYLSYSIGTILRQERETKKAVDCILDYHGTKLSRERKPNLDPIFIKNEAGEVKRGYQPPIDFCKRWATAHYRNIVKKDKQKSFRQECNQTNLENRLKNGIQAADKLRDRILNDQLPLLGPLITDGNDRWLNWQLLRIYFAWSIEWASKINQSGPSFKGEIDNDFYDMEYVVYLNNADGILTDDKLVSSLAKAAFPEKDVFSCLDEVTDDYRC